MNRLDVKDPLALLENAAIAIENIPPVRDEDRIFAELCRLARNALMNDLRSPVAWKLIEWCMLGCSEEEYNKVASSIRAQLS